LQARIALCERFIVGEASLLNETMKFTLNVRVWSRKDMGAVRMRVRAEIMANIWIHRGGTFLSRWSPRTCGREGLEGRSIRAATGRRAEAADKAAAGPADIFLLLSTFSIQSTSFRTRFAANSDHDPECHIFTCGAGASIVRSRNHVRCHRAHLDLTCRRPTFASTMLSPASADSGDEGLVELGENGSHDAGKGGRIGCCGERERENNQLSLEVF